MHLSVPGLWPQLRVPCPEGTIGGLIFDTGTGTGTDQNRTAGPAPVTGTGGAGAGNGLLFINGTL